MGDGTGLLTKPLMFLSSYAPLFAILAIRFQEGSLRLACGAIAAIGVAGLVTHLHFQHQPKEHQVRHTLKEARAAGEGAASYLASYLLPFVTLSNPSRTDLIGYFLFLCVAYVVATQTNVIQVNPTLFLLGYRVLHVTDLQGAQRYIISRSAMTIDAGATIRASRMTNDVLILESIENPEED